MKRFCILTFAVLSLTNCKKSEIKKSSQVPPADVNLTSNTASPQEATASPVIDDTLPNTLSLVGIKYEAPDLTDVDQPSNSNTKITASYSINRYSDYMLGTPDNSAKTFRYSPKHKIAYYDRGYGRPERKAKSLATIKNYVSKFIAKKVPAKVSTAFESYGTAMVSSNDFIGKEIDTQFDLISSKWKACGGRWASVANRVPKSSLKIYVMPSLFYACGTTVGCVWAGGLSAYDNRLYAVNAYVKGFLSAPTNGSLANFGPTIAWEIGNWFGFNYGIHPKTLAQEVGSKSPCGK